ncbi:uncharacterized protein LOC6530559 [Drosophila yakuba]|uniref:DUF753 domain-containing protein n=1 Tax=Drosophila yakuba TaxID=7245 RepID=B4P8E4_DROYA|nr:uncharacterized protein LOC6530559 [Drosophila yakuba]EDW91184.1 uncharacterized protein Dyak_GE13674 [Drosophila yakuba]
MKSTTAGVALLLLVLNHSSDALIHNWHSGPINCYECSTLDECSAGSGTLRKCLGNDGQSCVAIFNSNGAVIERGCSDNLESSCTASGDDCYECRSHGCNFLKTKENFLDCVVCDAQSDDNCVFDIELVTERRKCNQQCITALYPTNSEEGAPLELVRSCLDDLDLDDREACSEGSLENCVACSTASCNKEELGVRGSCNVCKGDCSNPQSKTCRAVPSGDKPESCFIEIDTSGAIYEMGCLSQYNVSDVTLMETNKQLWYCTGDNCNVESALAKPQTCKLCSSRTDDDCAVAPENVESVTVCESLVNTDCYSRILDDGHTERGCLTSLEGEDYLDCLKDANSTKCLRCTGESCNELLQPTERLTCQICDSGEDASCEGSPSASALCLLHTADQQCITVIDLLGNTQRGCSASLECESSNPKKCEVCSGADCNTGNLKRLADGQPGLWGQSLPLSCQSCSDATSCAASDLLNTTCSSDSEYCVTVFSANGSVSAKGCSQVVEETWASYCDANDGNCHNCNSNGCNSARSLDSYTECIYCDYENEDCATNAANVKSRRLCNGQCFTASRRRSTENFVYDTVRGCLDDKDPEDQATCIAGTDAACIACTGANCNVENIAEVSQSCYKCSGSDCDDPQASQCSSYSPDDRCYILFDYNADITGMGCLSDLDEEFVEDKFHSLLFCDDNDCNFFDILPVPHQCIVCDSSDDPNCATDPSKITLIGNCGVLPYTSCQTRIISGRTQRSCLSSLEREQLQECLDGTGNCVVCTGDRCNADIYPADRRRCQRCDSVTDPTCSSAPDASEVCPYYLEDEGCSAKLVNGETYRGCQREFTCDDDDKQHCRMCSGKDNCNVADLFNSYIGYPSKWITPPVNCYSCNGTECQGTSSGTLRKCTGNDEQNCGTVFDASGSVIFRGCTDTLYADTELLQYCDENSANCKFCKSSGCNNAKELSTYVDCVFCDGSDEAQCVRDVSDINRTLSCQGSCFTGLYPRNRSEVNPVYDLARGCLDDLDYDDRAACSAGSLEHCVSCSAASCNKADVPEDRLSCNVCQDAACETLTSQLCLGYRSGDQCYIHVGVGTVKAMGCATDLQDSFLLTNRRDLYLCSGDNCNTKDKLKLEGVACNVCNSTYDDGCVGGSAALSTDCEHYINPECYSYLNEDGVLLRGCLKDTDDELFDECSSAGTTNCTICSTNNCNSDVYPADWLTCLRCDSASDSDCALNPSSYSSYCRTYSDDDACVTSLTNGRTRRGCQSEVNCDASQAGSCRVCSGANCNTVDLQSSYVGEPGKWTDLPLSCHVCSDAASCATVGTATTKCEGNNKQTCSTVFNSEGQVVARGCSDSVLAANADYCDLDGDKCPQCKSDGCNTAVSLDSYVDCYFCDAEDDVNCSWEKPETTRKCQGQCMTGLYPRSSSWDSALLPTRGCLDDLNEAERASCAAGTHSNCTACTGSLCNGDDVIANPLECYTCKDPYCESPETSKCVAYRENDQCYLAYDDSGVVAMGCASDFETQVIKELVAQQRLLLCSGQKCNEYSITPDPNTCLQCSSTDDSRCATNPNQLTTTNICSQLPYTECVTQIDSQGNTIRGCISSLGGDDFYECLTGDGKLCETCTGERCNGLSVFPADRRKCYQCDSSSDPNCATSPATLTNTVCPIYSQDESCVTTLLNGITYRGCNSSLTCSDPFDSRTCRVCTSGDGCNTINLEKIGEDGLPGVWQDVPIECLVCSGTDCASGGGTLTKCSGYDNCVTVFSDAGSVTQRGCSESVFEESDYCDENPASCPRCNSNGCNTADSQDNYVECIVCDSSVDSNCVSNPTQITKTRQCHERCVSAFLPLFNETEDPSYALIRNCYDDLEKEDRDACRSGSKRFCATCEGAKCNSEDLVASRQSCLVCQGDECQSAKAASCSNYREHDECYIQFDEERSISSLGCLSELSHDDIYLLKRSKRLLTCSDNDCNTIESVPETQTCTLCSSRTDVNCAISPSSVTTATDCSLGGFPECYSRVLSDGSTERGCLSNLEDDEFLSCYNSTSATCNSCQGNNCNQLVYPSDRRSCHVCNSETDSNCENNPSSLTVCDLYAADDQCVTNLRNGVTYRNCASSLSCEANAKSCVYCEGDGCNQIDLAAKSDDNIGKWQDLPLECLTCEGTGCQEEDIPSVKCQNNNEQDCLTVFGSDGAVTRRGCQDEVEADATISTYCGTNAGSCPSCKSNNCNNATALSQYTTCIYCDSYKDSSCLWDPTSASHRTRQCQGQCMTALYGSADAGLDLIRTCLDDKEASDQLNCASGSDTTCAACSGDSCNVQSLPEDRQSCYTCEGDECEDPQPKTCAIYKPEDSCFLWVDEDNDLKQLGCLSSFRNQDLEAIIKTKRIAVCNGTNCNVPQLQSPVRCAVCDSREDPSCATDALAIGTFNTCSQLPHTGCYTRLENDGSTQRGCLYDLGQTDFASCLLGSDANCTVCSVDGCNREIFPADRQVCYSCTSEDDSSCESDPSYTLACPWVSDTETCKTLLSGNVTTRGCSSIVECESSDFRNCRSCSGSECNAIDLANRVDDGQHGLYQTLPLKCHTCVGEHCLSSLGPAVTCSLNLEQDCKTVFEADGVSVRRRGCSDDVDDYEDRYCRKNPALCFTCKSNECNDAWSTAEYVSCTFCNSANKSSCITDPKESDLSTRSCKGQCLVALSGADLIRSCLDDKELYDRSDCSTDESGTNCATCSGAECNTFSYPADRLSCHTCADATCSSSRSQACLAYVSDDYCFAKYATDGGLELMGCASSQNDSSLEQWQQGNLLYSCQGSECNELSRLPAEGECLSCDSSKSLECAQDPTGVLTTITCHAPNADCITRLVDGHTIRGCKSALSSAESSSCVADGTCSACSGAKCNAEIFPNNRRRCYICNSINDPLCAKHPQSVAVCPVYAANDECVTTFNDGVLRRGCASELECEIDNEDHCNKCATDGCNTVELTGSAGGLSGLGLGLTLIVAWLISSTQRL